MMAARTIFLICAFYLILILTTHGVAGDLGIGWGRQSSNKLLPSAVVDMILANGIQKVKLFSYNVAVLKAFSMTNLDVMVSLAHVDLIQVNTSDVAEKWVQQNITATINTHVNISHVLVGHEPFTTVKGDTFHVDQIFPSVMNIQTALNNANLGYIKVTIPHFTDILKSGITKPSEGDFRDDKKELMAKILNYLDSQNSPFMFNMYPMFNLHEKGYPLEFGFIEDNKNYTIEDGDHVYTNVFDAMYDTVVSALRKYGYPNMKIIVGQVGWPTDGDVYANPKNAKRFYDGFIKKMVNKKGTPLQPGPLDAYIYSLTDENYRIMDVRGPAERHYGIYKHDGQPKFDMDLSPLGGNKKLEPAQGISHMPRLWCVFDPNRTANVEQHMRYLNKTCVKADCSSLTYGASCHDILDFKGNLSYAFNMHFQMNNQRVREDACNFDGLGVVVDKNPSQGTCEFPLQIIATLYVGGAPGEGEMSATLIAKAGERLHLGLGISVIVTLFSIFLTCILG